MISQYFTPRILLSCSRRSNAKIIGNDLSAHWISLALVLLVSVVGALAQKAPSAKPFERFDGCVLEPDEWTDGDSFRVRLPDGRLETFRLYFVDTTESRLRGKRSDEQAAYFGLTRAGAIKLGEEAKAFTAAALQRPFTIQTRWRKVFGPTRYYACRIHRRRQRSRGTSRKKWSGPYLRNAHDTSRR